MTCENTILQYCVIISLCPRPLLLCEGKIKESVPVRSRSVVTFPLSHLNLSSFRSRSRVLRLPLLPALGSPVSDRGRDRRGGEEGVHSFLAPGTRGRRVRHFVGRTHTEPKSRQVCRTSFRGTYETGAESSRSGRKSSPPSTGRTWPASLGELRTNRSSSPPCVLGRRRPRPPPPCTGQGNGAAGAAKQESGAGKSGTLRGWAARRRHHARSGGPALRVARLRSPTGRRPLLLHCRTLGLRPDPAAKPAPPVERRFLPRKGAKGGTRPEDTEIKGATAGREVKTG